MPQNHSLLTSFKEEHREIRDAVYALVDSLRSGNIANARSELAHLNSLAGPHFRYEEETMYPLLIDSFPEGYIESKIEDHDGAIKTGHFLATLLEQDELSEAQRKEAANRALQLIIHVSDCDGLSVIMERFAQSDLDTISDNQTNAYNANIPLLEWATSIRERQIV